MAHDTRREFASLLTLEDAVLGVSLALVTLLTHEVPSAEAEAPSPDLFYTAEEMRQVTFSRSGSVNGEYAHFASYRRLPSGNVDMTVLTAVYSDPLQLERFVVKVGPNRPLILFSHQLSLTRA